MGLRTDLNYTRLYTQFAVYRQEIRAVTFLAYGTMLQLLSGQRLIGSLLIGSVLQTNALTNNPK